MESCVCERNAILVEVVANRNLSAERVTAVVKVNLVVLVVTSLNEYRDIQLCT